MKILRTLNDRFTARSKATSRTLPRLIGTVVVATLALTAIGLVARGLVDDEGRPSQPDAGGSGSDNPTPADTACGGPGEATTAESRSSQTPAPDGSEQGEPVLPEPTGPEPVGTVALHLVDDARQDPWVPAQPFRELMIRVWYPAVNVDGHQLASYRPSPRIVEAMFSRYGIPPDAMHLPATAHAYEGAPAARQDAPRPVVLFSTGLGSVSWSSTALVEDLASHGYVVVSIDHTYEAGAVEFPDGRVVTANEATSTPSDDDALNDRIDDARLLDSLYVLDQVVALGRGDNPDDAGRTLPAGLSELLDHSQIGMFGHSRGGNTTAATMHADPRVKAGINMDGGLEGPFLTEGLDQPMLLFGTEAENRDTDPTWASLWENLRGDRLELRLESAGHWSFSDMQLFAPTSDLPAELVTPMVGTIDPYRSMDTQRAFIRAFFDRHLRGCDPELLHGPSPHHPEVQFVP